MSEQEKIEIITEVEPSKTGVYQRKDEHGRVNHGDASGEWTLDVNGDVDDIVFFLSPSAAARWAGTRVGREPAVATASKQTLTGSSAAATC